MPFKEKGVADKWLRKTKIDLMNASMMRVAMNAELFSSPPDNSPDLKSTALWPIRHLAVADIPALLRITGLRFGRLPKEIIH